MSDDIRDEIPLGFGMALIKNGKSAKYFESCTKDQQMAIISQAKMINSKQEMQAFIEHLPSGAC